MVAAGNLVINFKSAPFGYNLATLYGCKRSSKLVCFSPLQRLYFLNGYQVIEPSDDVSSSDVLVLFQSLSAQVSELQRDLVISCL